VALNRGASGADLEAQTFWPDWYDLPDEYIDKLTAEDKA
jgi:hypothetical protein